MAEREGKYTCCANDTGSSSGTRNDFHLRGTSLGGLFVLEPWLTPSLFYQFLGKTATYGDGARKHIAIDSYTFCLALGAKEANRQLRQHWKTWVDEEQIVNLSKIGVDTLRIPVSDWMFMTYHPYTGCWDGALDELDRVLRLCERYSIKVLLDVHAMRMSQNGLDNSGNTGDYTWGQGVEIENGRRESYYRHWDIRGGNWIGNFNVTTHSYNTFNRTNIEASLELIDIIVDRYKSVPIVIGLEPVNEPWWHIPLEELKDFYWESYKIVKAKAPLWITLFHDSFRLWPSTFGGDWMKNCNNWAMDTHLYQAWSEPTTSDIYVSRTCGAGSNLRLMESLGVPVIVGEWSLATDNCAMWLNGLNDNVPGFPKLACKRVECSASYMGEQPGAPPRLDPAADTMDPRGSGGESFVINGTCPVSGHFNPDSVRKLANAQMNVFDLHTHGNFFWNFRTELEEPLWDYQQAVKHKWLPIDYPNRSKDWHAIDSACLSTNENEISALSQYSESYKCYGIITIVFVIVIYIRRLVSFCRQLLVPISPYQPIPAASELSDTEL